MKKITLTLFTAMLSLASFAQVNTVVNVPTPNTAPGTTGLRAPNGTTGHTVMRGQYFIPTADLTALSPTITSFGFALTSGVNAAASGTLTVYLVHTSATSYTAGTTWNTAGMTTIYSGAYSIPVGAAAANVDLTLPSAFNYTGGALNIAYEYTAGVTAGTGAIYTAFAGTALGATGASASLTAPVLGGTGFRPVLRFGTPNTFTNEIVVQSINAPGKYPTTFATPQAVTAVIMNGSNITKTNIGVGLSIAGSNPFTNAQFIASLAAGATTVVTFAAAPTSVQGIQTVSVGVAPDQNNLTNTITQTQSVTCDVWAYNPPSGSYTAGVGFNTGSGIISSQFSTPVNATTTAVRIAVSTDTATPGNSIYGVLLNTAGTIIGQTNTVVVTPGMLGTFQTLNYTTTQALTAGTIYYTGLAQTANATGWFPLGSQATPVTPTNYYTSALTATAAPAFLASNLGYFGIEAVFTSTCGSIGLTELVAASKVAVYPNPTVNGKTTIAGLEGTNTVTVYNMLGQSVLTLTSDREVVSIDLSSQPLGNYLVRVTDSNKATKTVKIINQ
ncbi:MAG: T9SS type A sorting domain-containing protein [Bacteroidota bacterium]|nr:T9SS type A sorting domain-containing protein [Bacteroidota bacterium]